MRQSRLTETSGLYGQGVKNQSYWCAAGVLWKSTQEDTAVARVIEAAVC